MKFSMIVLAMTSLAMYSGCTKKEAAPTETPAAAPAAEATTLTVEVSDAMQFSTTALTAKTGTPVKLVLKSSATNAAMKHNLIVVQPGTDAEVNTAALAAGEAGGFIPQGNPNIVANTPTAAPGQTVEVTFTAPAPGEYPYICTTPGHYPVMKGILTVTP